MTIQLLAGLMSTSRGEISCNVKSMQSVGIDFQESCVGIREEKDIRRELPKHNIEMKLVDFVTV